MQDSESRAVVQRYARRLPAGKDGRYSCLNPDVWLGIQERQRSIITILSRHTQIPLDQLRVLEIGCGVGANLLELIRLGFDPGKLIGNELLPERAAVARRNLPSVCEVIQGDAMAIEYSPASFDIVYQSTVFTSLLDTDFQQQLATRLWQWVRPGGGVLWYDFIYNNPTNPDVRGVPVRRVRELFPEAELFVKRVTLAPPISRRVCRIHPFTYHLFNALPLLRTHVLCWLGKRIDR